MIHGLTTMLSSLFVISSSVTYNKINDRRKKGLS